jgi:hypothetical protein
VEACSLSGIRTIRESLYREKGSPEIHSLDSTLCVWEFYHLVVK